MRCSKCGKKITEPIYIGGVPYGPECARKIGLRRTKAKKISPMVVVDIEGAPLQCSTERLKEHIERIGFDDVVNVKISYAPKQHYFYWEGAQQLAAATCDSHGNIVFYPVMKEYTEEEVLEVLTHEYGHAVRCQLVKGDALKELKKMYLNARRTGRFVTHYASRNMEEFFAECFHHYVHKPDVLRKVNPSMYNWLRDRIFNGREF